MNTYKKPKTSDIYSLRGMYGTKHEFLYDSNLLLFQYITNGFLYFETDLKISIKHGKEKKKYQKEQQELEDKLTEA